MIENPRSVRHKPKFLCRLCKGDHLTHFFPATTLVQEAWYLSAGPSGSDSSLISQPSLVDTVIVSMQYLNDTTPFLGSDASLDHVVSSTSGHVDAIFG
jgi:hypothetical protein